MLHAPILHARLVRAMVGLALGALPALCSAQAAGSGVVLPTDLKPQDAYLSDFAQQAADLSHQGSQSVRRVLNHRPFVTPKGWRLVSVLPATAQSVDARGQEFVLFFQDQANGDVHTVSLTGEGAVTGRTLLRVRQQR